MDQINHIIDTASSVEINNLSIPRFVLIACFACLTVGLVVRFACGKLSCLNSAISSALGILSLYITAIFLFTSDLHLGFLLRSLPFLSIRGNCIAIFPILHSDFRMFCTELTKMLILSFLMNILELAIPKGKNIFLWIIFRCLTLAFACFFQAFISWSISAVLPEGLHTIAPTILFIVTVSLLLVGALKVFVGLALATVNPIIGALYTFFFANIIGQQISKAVLTTGLLSIVFITLDKMGYLLIDLSSVAFPILIPIVLVLLLFWYVIGQML